MMVLRIGALLLATAVCHTTGLLLHRGVAASDPYVTVVLFDSNYNGLFECWAKMFNKTSSRQALDVVTLDRGATAFAQDWAQGRAEASFSVQVAEDPSARKSPAAPKIVKHPPLVKPAVGEKHHQQPQVSRLEGLPQVKRAWRQKKRQELQASAVAAAAARAAAAPAAPTAPAVVPAVLAAVKPRSYSSRHVDARHSVETSSAFPSLWYSQTFWHSIKQRLSEGKHVLHSDLDALYVNDPWPLLEEAISAGDAGDADLVGVTDNFPVEAAEKNNFAINTGFMLFRNTEETTRLVDTMVGLIRRPDRGQPHHSNEQYMLNMYFAESGCNFTQKHIPLSRGFVDRARCGNISIALIGNQALRHDLDHSGGLVSRAKNLANVEKYQQAGFAVVHKKHEIAHKLCEISDPWWNK